MQRPNNLGRLTPLSLAAAIFTLAVPLGAYAFNGLSMRYSGDDFCYAGVLRTHGFFETQWYSYLHISTYNGDRYSLTLFSSLAGIFPPATTGILPGLAILLFLAGVYWVLLVATRLALPETRQPGRLALILMAEALVFFTLYMAPSLGQSLYWRSAMLPYLAPLVAGVFLTGAIISQSQKEGRLWGALTGCFLLSFVAGGFSETGAALQGAFLGLALAGVFLLARQKPGWPRQAAKLTAVSLLGTALALLLLFISPTNKARMDQLPPPPGLVEAAATALHGAIVFAYSSIKSQIIPNALLVLLFFALGFLSSTDWGIPAGQRPFSWGRWFLAGLVTAIAGAILLFSTMLPFAYIQHAYPELRALIISRFVMVLCQAVFGGLAGSAVLPALSLVRGQAGLPGDRPLRLAYFLSLAACLGLLAFSVYPLHAAQGELSQTWHYQKWARFWDARDLAIIQARQQGVKKVKVVKMDHIIPNVAELSPDAKHWYNGCAAIYYDVTSISASLPGWDEGDP
jgi:hypothetical protein